MEGGIVIVVEGAQADVFAAVTTGDEGQRFANQIEDVGSGSDEILKVTGKASSQQNLSDVG